MIRGRRTALLAVLAVAASALVLPATPAGAATFDNACVNSLIPTQASLIPITMTADASPNPVAPGGTVTLSNIQQHSDIPPAVFVAGYNAGVLTTGANNIPVTNIHSVIAGTNTVEGTQTTNDQTGTATTTITDPNGTPGTGDEAATPGSLDVTYANQTWTAGASGTINFREFTTPPPVTTTTGGINITAKVAGIITVRFGCDPGEVVESGSPNTIQYLDPAPTFASTRDHEPPVQEAPEEAQEGKEGEEQGQGQDDPQAAPKARLLAEARLDSDIQGRPTSDGTLRPVAVRPASGRARLCSVA